MNIGGADNVDGLIAEGRVPVALECALIRNTRGMRLISKRVQIGRCKRLRLLPLPRILNSFFTPADELRDVS